jgi:DtxR family transcriptional regulator, Mn-dependent transcriptional regulator
MRCCSAFHGRAVERTMNGRPMVSRRTIKELISSPSRSAGRSNRVVASLTVENYVKTIALIAARHPAGGPVGTGELAQALNVSPGTVTGMLKTLSEANLATYTPYEGARLTDSGQRLAMKVIRRHRLLERFLAETLTMSWDEVHEEAEHMEHAASERLIDRIDAYLGYPAVDPHGDPIPRADGSLAETEGVPLARCQAGQYFRVVRVMDQDPAFLRYLSECGLELNSTGELLENRPEAGALVCKLGGRSVALGLAAAGKVLVIVGSQGDSSSAATKKMRGS